MKIDVLTVLSASAILFSLVTHASESSAKEPRPIGPVPPLSSKETQKGVEDGIFCTNANGLAFSRGAAINQHGKWYRCVKAYNEDFSDNRTLVWVEIQLRNGEFVTSD